MVIYIFTYHCFCKKNQYITQRSSRLLLLRPLLRPLLLRLALPRLLLLFLLRALSLLVLLLRRFLRLLLLQFLLRRLPLGVRKSQRARPEQEHDVDAASQTALEDKLGAQGRARRFFALLWAFYVKYTVFFEQMSVRQIGHLCTWSEQSAHSDT